MASLSLIYNQIHFNFHHSSNSPSHCARPPTHQSWGGLAAACSSQLCVEKCGNPDLRPEALWETHVPLPILGSNQGGNGSSLRDHVYTRERKKHAYTHIHMGISVCLKDRDAEIQSTSTDGYHASGKNQVWTANWQLLPEQRGMRGKVPNLLHLCILTKYEAKLYLLHIEHWR